MKLHLPNLRFGLALLLITAVLGGTFLGGTFMEQSIKDGYHMLPMRRFFLRDAHSHGNFMAFYNVFASLLLANISLSNRLRSTASYAAMATVFLPVGLAIHGITGEQSPVGMIGILGAALSVAIMIYGSWKTRSE